MEMHWLLYALSALLIVIGLAGTVLPVLPGLPVTFLGMLLAAWADDFSKISGWTVLVLLALTLISVVVDFAATALGAKRVGASKLAMFGAAVGALAGGLLFSLPGLIAGPFLGAVAGELARGRAWRHASKVGFGT
jgi:uncharacterized protein YqgC (DUF456 family)